MTESKIVPLWIDGIIIGYRSAQLNSGYETFIHNGYQLYARESVVLAWYPGKSDGVADKRLENRDITGNTQYDRNYIPRDN